MYISNINTATVALNEITVEKIPGDETYHHISDNLTMLFINKGAAQISINDEEVTIKKHDLIIFNPDYQISIEPIRKLEWIHLDISGILFTSTFEVNSLQQVFIIEKVNPKIKDYLELALLESEERFRGTDIILKKLLECVMVHILRHNELSIKDSSVQLKHDEIELVQQYIRDNYSKKIKLDELSDLVGINKYYLIRLFKQKTGLSPIDYLIHIRLQEAEVLLANTNISISEISDRVGFHSPSHFSKTFRETNHITPTQYRKQCQKEKQESEQTSLFNNNETKKIID